MTHPLYRDWLDRQSGSPATVLSFELELLLTVLERITRMSETIDQVATDFAAYKGDVTTALGALSAQVADLKATIAATPAPGVPADVQAKIDALDASIKAADAVVNPPASTPAPVVDPATPAPASTTPGV